MRKACELNLMGNGCNKNSRSEILRFKIEMNWLYIIVGTGVQTRHIVVAGLVGLDLDHVDEGHDQVRDHVDDLGPENAVEDLNQGPDLDLNPVENDLALAPSEVDLAPERNLKKGAVGLLGVDLGELKNRKI